MSNYNNIICNSCGCQVCYSCGACASESCESASCPDRPKSDDVDLANTLQSEHIPASIANPDGNTLTVSLKELEQRGIDTATPIIQRLLDTTNTAINLKVGTSGYGRTGVLKVVIQALASFPTATSLEILPTDQYEDSMQKLVEGLKELERKGFYPNSRST
jgi:hypothetical protein